MSEGGSKDLKKRETWGLVKVREYSGDQLAYLT